MAKSRKRRRIVVVKDGACVDLPREFGHGKLLRAGGEDLGDEALILYAARRSIA
jgi:hypothetical protein